MVDRQLDANDVAVNPDVRWLSRLAVLDRNRSSLDEIIESRRVEADEIARQTLVYSPFTDGVSALALIAEAFVGEWSELTEHINHDLDGASVAIV